MKNTYSKGILHFFFFSSRRGTFLGACSELCIVKEGKDGELVMLKTLGAAKEYLEMVCDEKLGEHLLNQELPNEIVEEFVEYVRRTRLKEVEEKAISVQDLKRKSEKALMKC